MADVYMGWTFEYAKRMMLLIDNENLRWLEEPVIADDIDGYADLKTSCRTPISGGEYLQILHIEDAIYESDRTGTLITL